MASFIKLQCPTCGAQLKLADELSQFNCAFCGNKFLTDRKLADLRPDEREHFLPTITYTQRMKQWLRVAEYEVILHTVVEAAVEKQRVLFADVAFRNSTTGPLQCRHDQWIVFDLDGYTYEALRDFDSPPIYREQDKRYLGMSRVITPKMQLRGWLGYIIPAAAQLNCLQVSGGTPTRTVEFHVWSKS